MIFTLVAGPPNTVGTFVVLVRYYVFEELSQTSDQAVTAANNVQAALMLMLFQHFIQSAL